MHLSATCPRCPAGLTGDWTCPSHGEIPPLWRPHEASYDALGEHLVRADGFPTYLPWPPVADWRVTDFAFVRGAGEALATLTAVAGWTLADGPVEIVVVSEEPGTGLGARVARTVHSDPGTRIMTAPPTVKVRLDQHSVPLWAIDAPAPEDGIERTVLAGEARGRWLWLMVSPASAVMMLHKDWSLADVSGLGPALLELSFGGPAPAW